MEAKMRGSKRNRKSVMLKGMLPLSELMALAIISLCVGMAPPPPHSSIVQASASSPVPTAPIKAKIKPHVTNTKSMIKTASNKQINPIDLAAYEKAILETALMVSNAEAQRLASIHGLQI